MARRYLFGPVTAAFANQSLLRARQAGQCLALGQDAGLDLTVGPADSWEEIGIKLPEGFTPDFVALYLPYTQVPAGLWSAPVGEMVTLYPSSAHDWS